MAKLNDWTKGHLLGKVKTAHVETANLSNNAGQWIEESRVPSMTTAYNEAGYLVKEVFYALDGNVSQVGFTKYDPDGNRTSALRENQIRFNPQNDRSLLVNGEIFPITPK